MRPSTAAMAPVKPQLEDLQGVKVGDEVQDAAAETVYEHVEHPSPLRSVSSGSPRERVVGDVEEPEASEVAEQRWMVSLSCLVCT